MSRRKWILISQSAKTQHQMDQDLNARTDIVGKVEGKVGNNLVGKESLSEQNKDRAEMKTNN